MAPPHAVPGVEVGDERDGADVLLTFVEGHEFHRIIIYRECGGGGERDDHFVDASARPRRDRMMSLRGACGKYSIQ